MKARCKVCGNKTEDMRHVGVECFYKVNEDDIVPDADERQFFSEVGEDSSIWGKTRRYKSGTVDRFEIIDHGKDDRGVGHTELVPHQDPVPPIRLRENVLFSIDCCKSCRADFLQVFKRWRNGEFKEIGWR